MSAVAFADFFMSLMAFTPKLMFATAWLTSAATFKAIKVNKNAKKTPQIKPTTSQIFQRCYCPKINFSVALPGQIYRLLDKQLHILERISTNCDKQADVEVLPRTRCPKCFRQMDSASIQVEGMSKKRMKIGELRSCSNQGSVEYCPVPAEPMSSPRNEFIR